MIFGSLCDKSPDQISDLLDTATIYNTVDVFVVNSMTAAVTVGSTIYLFC